MEELLLDAHLKYRSGKLRESSVQYLRYVEFWAANQKEAVLSGHLYETKDEERDFDNVRLVLSKLNIIYKDLRSSASALPPLISQNQRAPSLRSFRSYQNILLHHNSEKNILIPLSPLIKTMILLGKNTNEYIKDLKANSKHKGTRSFMDIDENLNQAQIKSQTLLYNKIKMQILQSQKLLEHIKVIQERPLLQWNVESLAREIARINAGLFSKAIPFITECTNNGDKENRNYNKAVSADSESPLKRCGDFAKFLEHSITQQIIAHALRCALAEERSLDTSSAHKRNFSESVHTKQDKYENLGKSKDSFNEMDEILVALAVILFECYADYSGGVAIIRALMRPEIIRLRTAMGNKQTFVTSTVGKYLWCLPWEVSDIQASVPTERGKKYTTYLNHLESSQNKFGSAPKVMKPSRYYLSLDSDFEHQSHTDARIHQDDSVLLLLAIPYMPFHIRNISSVFSEHSAFSLKNVELDHILSRAYTMSGPGVKKLNDEIDILKNCYTANKTKLSKFPSSNQELSSQTSDDKLALLNDSNGQGIRLLISPLVFVKHVDLYLTTSLDFYTRADFSVQHWLLSRPCLNTNQLRDSSFALVPVSTMDENLQWFPNEDGCSHNATHAIHSKHLAYKNGADHTFTGLSESDYDEDSCYSSSLSGSEDDADISKPYDYDYLDAQPLTRFDGISPG